jgi:hypothetical protein
MSQFFNISNYDVVFLSYDEPNADTNWENIKKQLPNAKRVHGVKGSDSAHKACANIATTERLTIIDGDNWLWGDLLNQTVVLEDHVDPSISVFSWPARNSINGLLYGNGGIKCWPRQAILDMRTHENADPSNDVSQVDFCWELNYIPIDQSYSTVVNNASKLQAWRAGFREGTKMVLDQGVKVTELTKINKNNLNRLKTWMTVGLDEEHGIWAILGARQGCYLTHFTDWDYTLVRDFDWLNQYYNDHIESLDVRSANDEIIRLGGLISIDALVAEPFSYGQSIMFKSMDMNPKRQPSFVSTHKNHAYDIVMITYNETNAEENYTKLRDRFPEAKRIHGVKGIHQAHIEAAKICNTDMFWIVDGDAEIDPSFNFGFWLDKADDAVRVWRCKNPVNDLVYGYGGVKLFPRQKTIGMDISKPDMTTSISTNYIPVMELSNITRYNTDPFNTWKSAFRECCKLSSKVIDRQVDDETNKRLDIWCSVGADRKFGKYAIEGAIAGRKYGEINQNNLDALKNINDFIWLKEQFDVSNS